MNLQGWRYLNHIANRWLTVKLIGNLIRSVMAVEGMNNLRFWSTTCLKLRGSSCLHGYCIISVSCAGILQIFGKLYYRYSMDKMRKLRLLGNTISRELYRRVGTKLPIGVLPCWPLGDPAMNSAFCSGTRTTGLVKHGWTTLVVASIET